MTNNIKILVNAYKETKRNDKNAKINLGNYLLNGDLNIFTLNNVRDEVSKLDCFDTLCDVKISVLNSLINSIGEKKENDPNFIHLLKNSITQLNDINSSLESSLCFFDSDSIIEIIEKDYNNDDIANNVFSGKYDYNEMLKIRMALMEIKRIELEKDRMKKSNIK